MKKRTKSHKTDDNEVVLDTDNDNDYDQTEDSSAEELPESSLPKSPPLTTSKSSTEAETRKRHHSNHHSQSTHHHSEHSHHHKKHHHEHHDGDSNDRSDRSSSRNRSGTVNNPNDNSSANNSNNSNLGQQTPIHIHHHHHHHHHHHYHNHNGSGNHSASSSSPQGPTTISPPPTAPLIGSPTEHISPGQSNSSGSNKTIVLTDSTLQSPPQVTVSSTNTPINAPTPPSSSSSSHIHSIPLIQDGRSSLRKKLSKLFNNSGNNNTPNTGFTSGNSTPYNGATIIGSGNVFTGSNLSITSNIHHINHTNHITHTHTTHTNHITHTHKHQHSREDTDTERPIMSKTMNRDIKDMFWISYEAVGENRTITVTYPIPAVFVQYVDPDDPSFEPWFTIIYCLDKDEDMGTALRTWFKELSKELKVNVLGFDYTGCGRHEGVPSEEAAYLDITACYLCMTQEKGISGDRIIICARGMGAGPAVHLADLLSSSRGPFPVANIAWSKITPDPVECPLPSPQPEMLISSGAQGQSPLVKKGKKHKKKGGTMTPSQSPLPVLSAAVDAVGISEIAGLILLAGASASTSEIQFDITKKAGKVQFPVLMVHGTKDTIVPINSARKLSGLFPKLVDFVEVQDTSHRNIYYHLSDYVPHLTKFLTDVSHGQYTREEDNTLFKESDKPISVIKTWIKSRGLAKYMDNILALNCRKLEDLRFVTSEELQDAGIRDSFIQSLFINLIGQAHCNQYSTFNIHCSF